MVNKMTSTRKLMSLAALVLLGTTTAANAASTSNAKMDFTVTQADEWNLEWKPAGVHLESGTLAQDTDVGTLVLTRVAGGDARAKMTLPDQGTMEPQAFSWKNETTGATVLGKMDTSHASIGDGVLVIGGNNGGTAPIKNGQAINVDAWVMSNNLDLVPGIYSANVEVATYNK